MVRKRAPEVVDLTDEPPQKQSRQYGPPAVTPSNSFSSQPTYPSSSFPPSSSASASTSFTTTNPSSQFGPRSSWVGNDDEDTINLTQADDVPAAAPVEHYGYFDDKIVGVRYYKGAVTPGEMILVRREPHNPYDRNAFRIDNVMRQQIGHLGRKVAAKLAYYTDQCDCIVEGTLTGEKGAWDCPVRLYIYGPSNPAQRKELEEKLKKDRLLKATQLKATKLEAEAQRKSAQMGFKGAPNAPGEPGDDGQNVTIHPSVAKELEMVDVRSEADLLKNFAMDEDMLSRLPMADQPEQIKSQLLPYQLQGLEWMTAKENPQVPAPGSQDVVQLWKRTQHNNFLNLASGFVSSARPHLLSGGILSDDMGLGKTVQTISLILSTKSKEPTLIIAPVGVMSNWEDQILHHVKPEYAPRIMRYHRLSKTSGAQLEAEFKKHDVVITSYGKLHTDFKAGEKAGLFAVNWRRVVLDEGHQIRNPATTNAKAACALKAQSRWALTGTPIVNSLKDLQSLLQFLHISGGVEDVSIFSARISRPLEGQLRDQAGMGSSQKAKALMQYLCYDLCLRRVKSMNFVDIRLPEKTMKLCMVPFRADERTKYDALMAEAQGMLERYEQQIRQPKESKGESNGGAKTFNVLERLLRLRQMCCHWTLCKDRVQDVLALLEDQKVVKFTKENLNILQKALRIATRTGEECSICCENIELNQPVITACKHFFCKGCITKWLGRNDDGSCPNCRHELAMDDLVELTSNDLDNQDQTPNTIDTNPETRSSKTIELSNILGRTLLDPQSKVIVFSQWTSFLDVIEGDLATYKYGYTRIDGTMPPARRDQAVAALNGDPNTRVLLASLSVCSVGLNLTAADTVVLADSWWAPAIEDQAIDRVHRLGQTRPTTIYRLIMEGSVEERILAIQDEKRKLVSMAFEEGGRKDSGEESGGKGKKEKTTRMDDVRRLLS